MSPHKFHPLISAGSFATKIFHPNVAPATGEICVSTLKKDWKKEYGVGHILITVKCLLIHPNPESALHEEAGKLLLEAYDDYARHARLMTDVHARHRPAEFDVPSSSEASSSYQQTVPTAVQSVPTARSLATSLTPVIALQSNHSPVDVAMAVDYPEKPHHSANQATTVIPKKRSAPTSSTSATTPASGQQFYAQPSLHQPSTVLGLASHTSGNNAIRPKPQAALTGTGVSSNPQKKRGLKRL